MMLLELHGITLQSRLIIARWECFHIFMHCVCVCMCVGCVCVVSVDVYVCVCVCGVCWCVCVCVLGCVDRTPLQACQLALPQNRADSGFFVVVSAVSRTGNYQLASM